MSYCKARKNGSTNRNSKTEEEEKEDDEGGQALGSHFEVENQNKGETEEKEEVKNIVTGLLSLQDDEYGITYNDDISFASIKLEEEMICIHSDTIDADKEETETTENNQGIVDAEVMERE